MEDADAQKRMKTATMADLTTVGSGSEPAKGTDKAKPAGSPLLSSSKRQTRFQHPIGPVKRPGSPPKCVKVRLAPSGPSGWIQDPDPGTTDPAGSDLPGPPIWRRETKGSDLDSGSDLEPKPKKLRRAAAPQQYACTIQELALQVARSSSVLLTTHQALEEARAARCVAEHHSAQTAQTMQQAQMVLQQALEEERTARCVAEQRSAQTAQTMQQAQMVQMTREQQERLDRAALEARIAAGTRDYDMLRQAANRYQEEVQHILNSQSAKIAQLQATCLGFRV